MIFQNVSRKITIVVIGGIIVIGINSCRKYLDKKPNKSDAVPTSLNDLQAILDNTTFMNSSTSGLPELMADNYYILSDLYNSDGTAAGKLYLWEKDIDESSSWSTIYTGSVYFANVVLDQLPLIKHSAEEDERYDNIKGAALFYRAFAFYQLSQLYCKPYSSNAATDLGIVLKMTSSINEKISRATVQQTYSQIIADLKEAFNLLPAIVSVSTRPSKTAANAALARVYLSMRNYLNAGFYANLALQQYNVLLDYNTRVPISNPVIPRFNSEVIFHSHVGNIPGIIAGATNTRVDSLLYLTYDGNDLRKTVFFIQNTGANAGTYRFRGSYMGQTSAGARVFDGLATDELYLIRAECYAKNGNTTAALADINTLLRKRWANNLFTDITAANATEALQKIRTERRRELIFRNQRWSDIRRYNLEDSSITLKRIINGTTYTLAPGDLRWELLIPWAEVNRSGISQNPR